MRLVHEKKITEDESYKKLSKIGVFPEKELTKDKKIAQSSEEIVALSVSGNITLPQPFALYDTYTGYWYAGAHFWSNFSL